MDHEFLALKRCVESVRYPLGLATLAVLRRRGAYYWERGQPYQVALPLFIVRPFASQNLTLTTIADNSLRICIRRADHLNKLFEAIQQKESLMLINHTRRITLECENRGYTTTQQRSGDHGLVTNQKGLPASTHTSRGPERHNRDTVTMNI